MEQKRFLRYFVKSVDVSRSEATVRYTLPMPPLNLDKDTVGVLAFDRCRGEPMGSIDRTHKMVFKAEFAFAK